MRVWDVPPRHLCRAHLLGEHRELHAIWAILTQHKKGYRRHPETKRWVGKLRALYERHLRLVGELQRRGYKHFSPLDKRLATGNVRQTTYVNTLPEQRKLLRNKLCDCYVSVEK